ncbi:MAG: energy transducer TonB [Acidobacteriota bacterium]|nr:energy transducer TonB [Acidobacteriota bacterium]
MRIRTLSLALPLALLACLPVSGVAANRAVVTRSQPRYPELARQMHVAGMVIISAMVLPNGTVSATSVQSGHPLLAAAAQEAVSRWKFEPSTEPSTEIIEIRFNGDSH